MRQHIFRSNSVIKVEGDFLDFFVNLTVAIVRTVRQAI